MAERILRIKVLPNRPKTEWGDVLDNGTQKIKVAAPAEKGKANKALLRFLAKEWKVPTNNVEIISGKTDALKLIKVHDAPTS